MEEYQIGPYAEYPTPFHYGVSMSRGLSWTTRTSPWPTAYTAGQGSFSRKTTCPLRKWQSGAMVANRWKPAARASENNRPPCKMSIMSTDVIQVEVRDCRRGVRLHCTPIAGS